MKVSQIIDMANALVSLDTRMAIRVKINDRKWSDTVKILKNEKSRLESEIRNIDDAIKFLGQLEE
jgi:CYTH domain-containing protein